MVNSSTDSFNGSRFPPHGKIDISVINSNIVAYHAQGPFNAELLVALDYIESKVLKELKNKMKNWGAMVIFETSCMALDEVIIGFGEYLKVIKNNKLQAVATAFIISSEIEGGWIMARKYQKCYDDADIVFSIFDNEKDALVWVNSYLANI